MFALKSCVCVGFLLLALVSMSHAACWNALHDEGATHCQDLVDKTLHPIGSDWTNSKCDHCTCYDTGMRCCDGMPSRVSGGCFIKKDYKTCTYEIIQTDKNAGCRGTGK